ncbi:MAG: hypothetical protein ABIP20_11305 [Chthoniobacteraceae bacterium]
MNPRPAIHLHIERVVLDGVTLTHAERPAFLAAVGEELRVLLVRSEWRELSAGTVAHAATQPIEWSCIGARSALGAEVARAIHRGVAETFAPAGDDAGIRREAPGMPAQTGGVARS